MSLWGCLPPATRPAASDSVAPAKNARRSFTFPLRINAPPLRMPCSDVPSTTAQRCGLQGHIAIDAGVAQCFVKSRGEAIQTSRGSPALGASSATLTSPPPKSGSRGDSTAVNGPIPHCPCARPLSRSFRGQGRGW